MTNTLDADEKIDHPRQTGKETGLRLAAYKEKAECEGRMSESDDVWREKETFKAPKQKREYG